MLGESPQVFVGKKGGAGQFSALDRAMSNTFALETPPILPGDPSFATPIFAYMTPRMHTITEEDQLKSFCSVILDVGAALCLAARRFHF